MTIEQWPTCATCCMAQSAEKGQRVWVPVEGYGIEERPPTGPRFRTRVEVTASCGHRGSDLTDPRKRDHQTAVFDVPEWWGDARVRDAIAALVFFKPGDARAEHGMVTDLG